MNDNSERSRRSIPTVADGDQAAKDYMDFHFNEKSRYRRRIMTRLACNLWMKMGRHWITFDPRAEATASGHRFVDVYRDGRQDLPRPVRNLIGEGIKNIVDRLMRKQYEPSTMADQPRPELEAAARLNKDLILYDLEREDFSNRVEETLVDDLITFGTGISCSILDEAYTATLSIASTTAMQCVGCNARFASPIVDSSADMDSLYHRDTMTQTDGGMQMSVCPRCEQATDLTQYKPGLGDEPDMFGRPMVESIPKPTPIWEAVSPFEMYPENGGLVDTWACKVWGRATVRSMEWVYAHIPDEFHDKITAEEPRELMKSHPTLGDPWFGGGGRVTDENVFGNHVMVRDLVVEPIDLGGDGEQDGLRWGRRIIKIGDYIVHNAALEREVQGSDERIPTVAYAAGVAERVRGEFFGRTPVDDARPMNQQLNRLMAQVEDLRERGITWFGVPEGVDMYNRDENATGSYRTFGYSTAGYAGGEWKPQDGLMNVNPATGNAYMEEHDRLVDAIQQALGPVPVESGLSDGAGSARQLMVQSEEAAQKLNRMDEARVRIVEKLFRHRSDIRWAFCRYDSEYERKSETGAFEKQSYNGEQILKQTKVKLEPKATFDRSLLQSQQAEKALMMGLYVDNQASGPIPQAIKDELLELMSMPKIQDAQSIQITRADQSWEAFMRDQSIPYVDSTIMDVWIWYQRLGKHWQSDEAMDLLRSVGWDGILKQIAGWEPQLVQAEASDAAQKSMYQGYPPEQWAGIYQKTSQLAAQAAQSSATLSAAAGQPAPPPPTIPQPPQGGKFLPEALCDRLVMLWSGMIKVQVMSPVGPVDLPFSQVQPAPAGMGGSLPAGNPMAMKSQLDPVLKFYAVIQECRLIDQRKKEAAAGGAQITAAPGGARTMAGNMPSQGQSVASAAPGGDAAIGGAA